MLYALLLAGGKSSRMGQDKRRLQFQGKSLLELSLSLLQETGADQVLLSGDVEGYESLPDLIPDCGPLGGLHAGLYYIWEHGQLDKDLLLVIPVDMPRLNVDSLARLVTNIGDADCCHYQGEIFPCLFRASGALLAHLESLFAESRELGGKRSMKALLAFGREKTLPLAGLPDDLFMNLNRPEDWQAFLAGESTR